MTKRFYAAIGGLWLSSLFAGPAVWDPGASSPIAAMTAEITAQPLPGGSEVVGAPSMESDRSPQPRLDLIGNEVENAVADYRVDVGGDVYERHSPETAVPKLDSPSS